MYPLQPIRKTKTGRNLFQPSEKNGLLIFIYPSNVSWSWDSSRQLSFPFFFCFWGQPNFLDRLLPCDSSAPGKPALAQVLWTSNPPTQEKPGNSAGPAQLLDYLFTYFLEKGFPCFRERKINRARPSLLTQDIRLIQRQQEREAVAFTETLASCPPSRTPVASLLVAAQTRYTSYQP